MLQSVSPAVTPKTDTSCIRRLTHHQKIAPLSLLTSVTQHHRRPPGIPSDVELLWSVHTWGLRCCLWSNILAFFFMMQTNTHLRLCCVRSVSVLMLLLHFPHPCPKGSAKETQRGLKGAQHALFIFLSNHRTVHADCTLLPHCSWPAATDSYHTHKDFCKCGR